MVKTINDRGLCSVYLHVPPFHSATGVIIISSSARAWTLGYHQFERHVRRMTIGCLTHPVSTRTRQHARTAHLLIKSYCRTMDMHFGTLLDLDRGQHDGELICYVLNFSLFTQTKYSLSLSLCHRGARIRNTLVPQVHRILLLCSVLEQLV